MHRLQLVLRLSFFSFLFPMGLCLLEYRNKQLVSSRHIPQRYSIELSRITSSAHVRSLELVRPRHRAAHHLLDYQGTDTISSPLPGNTNARARGRATLPPSPLPPACTCACDNSSVTVAAAPPASCSACHAMAKAKHATAAGAPAPKSASGGGASVASSAAEARARAAHSAAAAGGAGAVAASSNSGSCEWRSSVAHLHSAPARDA